MTRREGDKAAGVYGHVVSSFRIHTFVWADRDGVLATPLIKGYSN